MTFGELLRDARERKGYDLAQAARRLRIRTDILQAIEEGDFANMPPRGYTRNMVNAYAQLVGLNPTEITSMYLEEAHAYLEGGDAAAQRGSARPSATARSSSSSRSQRSGSPSRSRRSTTTTLDEARGTGTRVGTSRYSAPATREYSNFYTGDRSLMRKTQSKTPFFVAGIVVLVLLIIVLIVAFGCSGTNDEEDVPTVPITGISDTTDTGSSESDAESEESTTTSVAPTQATFTFSVADGESAYIEVYLDDEGASVAETIEGPEEQSFDVTGTLKFVTTNPDAVTATVDGEEVEPVDNNGKGVYTYTVDFSEILAAWQEENGVSTTDDDDETTSDEEDEEATEEATE